VTLLRVDKLSKHYPSESGEPVQALDEVSFTLARGEVLGVVGESGCGKSTLGRALLRLIEPNGGHVLFDGVDIATVSSRALKRLRRDLQIVFQDPFGSLNPRHTVAQLIGEPLIVHRIGTPSERRTRIQELLEMVGLPADAADKRAHAFSGGQRQRIAIARALALQPRLLVADEAVSALDVSIQSQIINLLAELQARFSIALLFISHDLSVVRHVSDRIAVMYLGRIVEIGPTESLMTAACHPYTQALISAVPRLDQLAAQRIVLDGELPDPAHPPPGCAFASRCPHVMDICRTVRPDLLARRAAARTTDAHSACHLHPPL